MDKQFGPDDDFDDELDDFEDDLEEEEDFPWEDEEEEEDDMKKYDLTFSSNDIDLLRKTLGSSLCVERHGSIIKLKASYDFGADDRQAFAAVGKTFHQAAGRIIQLITIISRAVTSDDIRGAVNSGQLKQTAVYFRNRHWESVIS